MLYGLKESTLYASFEIRKKTVSCGQDRVKTTVVLVVCTGGPVKDKYSCPVKFTASTAAVLDQLDSGSLCTLIPFV